MWTLEKRREEKKAAPLDHKAFQIFIREACEASDTFGLELLESPLWYKLPHF